MFRSKSVLICVIALLSLTGCSNYSAESREHVSPNIEPIESPFPEATTPVLPSTSPVDSIPEYSSEQCPEFDDALDLVNNWADVLGSRGSYDHAIQFAEFKGTVEDLHAESGNACPANAELEDMTVQLSGIEIMIEHMDVPENRFYNAFTINGNEWLDARDFRGIIFMTP